eukprot:CAMPEP_0194519162 /NCGR_PEP_ID=MMETSP0253-20130528/52753_1 /TAXON_ID=2966 /ORGANISM="Noctiluca scintillans" /LENGTH=132 /DNA_ID=CAMNT_0039363265 /DNA_START=133 /DNA_END=531 /DNA_ORIENTATION=+
MSHPSDHGDGVQDSSLKVERERERRLNDLAGDEELARELVEQLKLVSPAEKVDMSTVYEPTGFGRLAVSNGVNTLGHNVSNRHDVSDGLDTDYGVDYQALDSDSEDVFPPIRTVPDNYSSTICSVLTGFFKR